ncbi:hypothetical protein ACLKA7_015841 [Drosophila subpalustris]
MKQGLMFCLFFTWILSISAAASNDNETAVSCIPFGDSPGLHQLKLPDCDAFQVLCDSVIAGPGWAVIQQRINGKENFYRDWVTYRQGFGSFDGDFFLGLEKIYRLTSSQRHELYIHMERFNGGIETAHYDNFTISGEEDHYRLIRLDAQSGNATSDRMRWLVDQKFTTYDRDNDMYTWGNCAQERKGGWWYKSCATW